MKKILNEWRSFINETERKHPKRKTRGEYDRAATDYVRQRTQSKNDPRSELRYRISNITYHAADPRTSGVKIDSLVEFVNASRLKKKLIRDLFETMYQHNGIGLAAVQIGILKRIIVLDVSKKGEGKKPMCFINPVIKDSSNKTSI